MLTPWRVSSSGSRLKPPEHPRVQRSPARIPRDAGLVLQEQLRSSVPMMSPLPNAASTALIGVLMLNGGGYPRARGSPAPQHHRVLSRGSQTGRLM